MAPRAQPLGPSPAFEGGRHAYGYARSDHLRWHGLQPHSLFLMIGAHSDTDWLPEEILCDESGFIRTGIELDDAAAWPLERRPLSLETGMPGVVAVGDIRKSSANRVAAAVGEARSRRGWSTTCLRSSALRRPLNDALSCRVLGHPLVFGKMRGLGTSDWEYGNERKV